MKGRNNNNNNIPTFDDIDNIDDDLQHIGEVYPNDERIYDVQKHDQIASIKHHQSIDDKTDRSIRGRYDEKSLIDPTISYVKRGLILLPVNMILPTHYKEKINDDSSSSAPTYSVDQSRVSLFTSFPPPPTIVQPSSEGYSDIDLKYAKQRLKQHSGYHIAAGVTSATKLEEGYSESILSMNYRIPSLISWPPSLMGHNSIKRRQYLVSDMHYNLHLGSTTKTSFGSTLSTLDGKTHLRFDMGNPFYNMNSSNQNGGRNIQRRQKKNTSSMITSPSLQSDYTISASHDFNNSLCANWSMKIAPSPPLTFSPTNMSSTSPIHMQCMNLTLTNMTGVRKRHSPKLTLTLGYGMPLVGGEALWMSNVKPGTGEQEPITHRNCTDISSSASSVYSSNMKLEIEQDVSSTQTCNSTIEYCHTGQQFSLGTIFTRTFSSSRFARLGVGIRHTFDNIFNNSEWWKQGTTSWLFKLERGDVRLLIPVTIYPVSTTALDSLVRVVYVSMASIVVDIIVSELLCGVTASKLRLRFLKILLGKEMVDKVSSSLNFEIEKDQEEKEKWLLQEQLFKVQEHTARQVNLMVKQAKAATKREVDQGGLVIVKAIYGVIDNTSRQWIQYRDMDATTQLQFWVTNSSLHLPAVSKKHMLGFYDLVAFVSDDEWEVQPTTNQKGNRRNRLFGSWKEKLMGTKQKRRDLRVVLSIQYKWSNKLYQVMYHDDEAVDLPSQHAEETVVE